MIIEKRPGFYTLIHVPSGHFYFGSSTNLYNRFYTHRSAFKGGNHANPKLRSLNANFDDIRILITYTESIEDAKRWEKFYIDKNISNPLCCNVAPDPFNPIAGNAVYGSAEHMGKISKMAWEDRDKMVALNFKRVSIDGVIYESQSAAAEALGLSRPTITWGLKTGTGKYANWFRIGKDDK